MLAEIGSVDLRVSSYGSYTTLDKSAFREKRLSVGLERRSGRIAPNKSVYRPQSTSLARLPDESPRLEPGIQCEPPPPSTRPPEFLANHPSKRLLQRFPRLRNVSPKRIVDQALTIPPPAVSTHARNQPITTSSSRIAKNHIRASCESSYRRRSRGVAFLAEIRRSLSPCLRAFSRALPGSHSVSTYVQCTPVRQAASQPAKLTHDHKRPPQPSQSQADGIIINQAPPTLHKQSPSPPEPFFTPAMLYSNRVAASPLIIFKTLSRRQYDYFRQAT